jgi:hypothetical protein
MAASLISTTVSTNFTNNTASKVTPSVTWLAGDLISVWGWTGDNAQTLTNPPTATGLTLTNVLLSNVASKAKLYLWTTTAASGGSSAFTASSSVSTEGGLVVKVWRGASGFGTISSLGQGTTLAPSVSYTVTTRQVGKTVSATVTATASMVRSVGKPLTATVAATAVVGGAEGDLEGAHGDRRRDSLGGPQVGKALSRTVTTTASLVRQVGKPLTATVTATASQVAQKVILRTLTATVTVTGVWSVRSASR